MDVISWLVIRLSDNTVFGNQLNEPPAGAFNPALFAVKPWFGPEAVETSDEVNGVFVIDPTLSNPAYDTLLANYEAAQTGRGGARQWFADNPGAKTILTMTISQLEAEIDALDLSALPAQTANRMKLMFKLAMILLKVYARRERVHLND